MHLYSINLVSILLLTIFGVLLTESTSNSTIEQRLELAHSKIVQQFPYDTYSKTFLDNLDQSELSPGIKSVLEGVPVFIVGRNEGTGNLGNRMGEWLYYVGCRYAAGAHLILVPWPRLVDEIEQYESNYYYDGRFAVTRRIFSEQFPHYIMNPHPASNMSEALEKAMKMCRKISFPWELPLDLTQYIPFWRELLPRAFHNVTQQVVVNSSTLTNPSYLHFLNGLENSSHFHRAIGNEMMSRPLDTRSHLPMYPDVAIHYRCSDNVMFPKMGLLPYDVILRRVPADAKHIMILTEFGNVAAKDISDIPTRSVCRSAIQALYERLTARFPSARVVARAGYDVFLAFSILMHSRVVVCSASTFCFHAALPNAKGEVHVPLTKLLYGTSGMQLFRQSNAARNPIANVKLLEEVPPLAFD